MSPPASDKATPSSGPLLIQSKGLALEVLTLEGGIVEYQVEPIRKKGRLRLGDGVFVGGVAFLVQWLLDGYNGGWKFDFVQTLLLAFALLILWSRLNEIHYESALAFPAIGLQLETHRGLSIFGQRLTTSVSRLFIPVSSISDIIINEGLCGWNVRRYLAILPTKEPRLRVVFEALDPPFLILKEVYHGLRETLFDEWDDAKETGQQEAGSQHTDVSDVRTSSHVMAM